MKNPSKSFDSNLEKMRTEALIYLNFLVKNKFRQNKNLNSFILCMGTFFWTDLKGEVLYDHEVKDKLICNFIGEWDSVLKLTGEGVKWFRDGTIITNW